jgi:glycosyltransferase involved in cell wall biosynthesis
MNLAPSDKEGSPLAGEFPRASIVIPAHNEGKVVHRGLSSILESAAPGEFEIVVVCNGCSDDTAEQARRFGPAVKVVETEVQSKIHALNLGDREVKAFPRFYVDADIQITAHAIRQVTNLLRDDSSILVAAPRAVVAYEDRPYLIRSFYRVWTRLPYFCENMVGSGVYAFSRQGRARFGEFPPVIADDEFARLTAAPQERKSASGSSFTIHPPRTVGGLLKIMTRARTGMYELKEKFPDLTANNHTDSGRTLQIIARNPALWRDAPIYLSIMLLAKLKAHRRTRRGRDLSWQRDDTSRQ